MAQRSRIKKTTIVDIAAASGVSVTTVSRILNDKPDVAEETRERVLRVMEEYGFAPQSSWQQIRSGKSYLIAMHFPQDFNPPAHHVIFEAALGCEAAGYSINIIVNSLSDTDKKDLMEIIEDRYMTGSTIIASQLPIRDWHSFIGDPTIADAVCDRLFHVAHKFALKGDSMREKLESID